MANWLGKMGRKEETISVGEVKIKTCFGHVASSGEISHPHGDVRG